MTSFEQKRICGLIQNRIFETTGVFGDATSTGHSLTFKAEGIEKVKDLGLKLRKWKASGNVFYMLTINKTAAKKLNIA